MKGSRLLLVCCLVAVASALNSEEEEEEEEEEGGGGGGGGELVESDPEDTQGETRFLGGFLGEASSENNQEFDNTPGFGGGFNINPGFGGGFDTNPGFGGGFGGILGAINPGFSNSFEDQNTDFGHSFEDTNPDFGDGFGDTNPGFNDGFGDTNPGFNDGFGDTNPGFNDGFGDTNPGFSDFSDSSEHITNGFGGSFSTIKSGLGTGAFGPFGPIFAAGGFGLGTLGTCRYRCRSPQGQVYCCEGNIQPAPVIFVKPGECPPVRPSCPAVRSLDPPIYCSNDGRCNGVDKCCFDTCLQRSVCKPPIGSTGLGGFGP